MKLDSASIKNLIAAEGIDLVAIADARNLILSYPERPATRLMPTAKSVIVMAVAHSLGAAFAPGIQLWTRNKMQTSRLLDSTAEKVSRLLERQGFLSLPISADKPTEIFKRDPRTGKKFFHTRVCGQLSLKHAAMSAGMGVIGCNNLLLTPEFGPHQRLAAIVTEAELEPDPRRELKLCTECKKCEKACPAKALKNGKYDVDACFHYWSLGFERRKPKTLAEWPGYLKMLLEHSRKRDWFIELGQTYITDVDFCIECLKACPTGERSKKLRPDSEGIGVRPSVLS